MRRKDREMSRAYGLEVIDRAEFGVLSVSTETYPLSIPLSVAREGTALYFHSATAGEKVGALAENANVRIVFVDHVAAPSLFTANELREMRAEDISPRMLAAKVFTTEFSSAIVRGRVHLLSSDEEKLHALRVICERFTPAWMEWFDKAAKNSLPITLLYRVDIEEITAKRKRFGADGEERKPDREP